MEKKVTIFVILQIFGLSQIFAAPCGDVNSSGRIDITDALLTAQYYVGLNPEPFDVSAAEVSGDSKVTIVDALQIAQHYVGLITSFSGCGKPAIVFMVAGQSNAKGAGVLSPAIHKELGHDKDYKLVPGSTALEVGLPINADDYTHSYIWAPGINSFERIDPGTNTRVVKDAWNLGYHGMELPVVWELEKRFPGNDIYVIKWGVSATELFHDWNPERSDGEYATFLSFFNRGMTQLQDTYTHIRVVGLYWDQGESDGLEGKANEYDENLLNFFTAVRSDTRIPQLKIFVRKHIFNWTDIDIIIAAQQKVVQADPYSFLLDIDLGNRTENYKAWAFSPNNGHVSSKGFVELTKVLFDGPLNNATVDSFDILSE